MRERLTRLISEDEVCSSLIIKEERMTEQGSVSLVTLEPACSFVTELILMCDILNHCACLSQWQSFGSSYSFDCLSYLNSSIWDLPIAVDVVVVFL